MDRIICHCMCLRRVWTTRDLYSGNNRSLSFIQNKGQWPDKVDFRARLGNGSVFLEDQGFTYIQYDAADIDEAHHVAGEGPEERHSVKIDGHVWKARFIGSNKSAPVSGENLRSEYHNYFLGNDQSKWASKVPLYNQVSYEDLYDGVDLQVYSVHGRFKYDFIVDAGTDPAAIVMEYDFLDGIEVRDGKLVSVTSVGEYMENRPYAYQLVDGSPKQIACDYILKGSQVQFSFPEGYDTSLPLVIDPELIGATLSGGTVTNFGHCATYDNDKNIYTGAQSFGAGYPTDEGSFQTDFSSGVDMAFSKLNEDASGLIYATYYGGSGQDLPHSMVVGENNELYIFGTSQSLDCPVSDDAFDTTGPDGGTNADIVVAHFTEDGTDVVGATFVGGSADDGENSLTTNYADTYRGEIITDTDGNCYIASCTQSEDFPTTAGAFQETYGGGTRDVVVFSLNNDLSDLNCSTYVGGTNDEAGFSLRLDYEDNLYVCGVASDAFIPMTGYVDTYQGGTRDAFVFRLTDDGANIPESSLWGTEFVDAAFFLDIDNDGNVFLYGQSDGGTSEVTDGVYVNPGSQQFICSLSPDLATLNFGTVVGAGGDDFTPIAFMVDACGYIYFSAHGNLGLITGVPITDDALYETGGFYIGVLQPEAIDIEFSTLYSGNHVDGGTSRFDPANGTVYQAVCSCEAFTTTPDAFSDTPGGFCDVGVFKIDFGISHVSAQADASPAATGCAPFEVEFDNTGSGITYEWDFGDGSPATTEFEPTHTFTDPGEYEVRLIAYDPDGCLTSDTTYLTIVVDGVETPEASFDYDVNCATGEVTVTSTGTPDVPLEWDMGDGTTYSDDESLTHGYTGTGTFTITLTAGDGECADFATTTEEIVIGSPAVDIIFNQPSCFGFSDGSVTVDVLDPTGMETIEISNQDGDMLNPEGSNTANLLTSGWYIYHVDLGDGCETLDSIFLENPPELNAQINTVDPLCFGDETGIAVVDSVYNAQGSYDGITYIWTPDPVDVSGLGADSIYNLGKGQYTLTINDENGCSRVFDFEINEPDELIFAEFGSDPAYCRQFNYQNGNGVVFAAATGGTPHYDYQWTHLETGTTTDNSTWGGLNPGTYEIVVTDQNGCILTDIIQLDSLNPVADFDITIDQIPTDCDAIVPVDVTFTNTSYNFADPNDPDNDTTFFNNFGDPTSDENWAITHEFPATYEATYTESGAHEVCLAVINKNGCVDTTCKTLKICDDLEFEPVNIFTPNADGSNDLFTFVFRSEAVVLFNCVVVDRWGVVIAEFDHIENGWDGTDSDNNPCPDGTYFYTYTGRAQTGEEFAGMGTVQLVRGN